MSVYVTVASTFTFALAADSIVVELYVTRFIAICDVLPFFIFTVIAENDKLGTLTVISALA